jgi:PKD repeat protein
MQHSAKIGLLLFVLIGICVVPAMATNYTNNISCNFTVGEITNYPIILDIFNGTGTTSGANIYLNGGSLQWNNGQPNDIFFSDSSNATLNYWIENTSCNLSHSVVHVLVQNTSLNMTVSWGNSTVASLSNGTTTFPYLFDHFDNATLNTGIWTNSNGALLQSASVMKIYGATGATLKGIYSVPTFAPQTKFKAYAKMVSNASTVDVLGPVNSAITNGSYIVGAGNSGTPYGLSTRTAGSNTDTAITGATIDNNYHIFQVIRNGSTSTTAYSDAFTGTSTTNLHQGNLSLFAGGYGVSECDIDWIFVAPYDYRNPNPATWNIPAPSFITNVTSDLGPLSVQFTDTSTGTITGWNWSFGDGTFDTTQNPVHTFNSLKTFPVTLTVTSSSGNYTSNPTSITSLGIKYNSTLSQNTTYNVQYMSIMDGYLWGSKSKYNTGGVIDKYYKNNNTLISETVQSGTTNPVAESYIPYVYGDYVYLDGSTYPNAREYLEIFYKNNLTSAATFEMNNMGFPIYDPIHNKILFSGYGNGYGWPINTNWSIYQLDPTLSLNQSAYQEINITPNIYTVGETYAYYSNIAIWNNTVWVEFETPGTSGYLWNISVWKTTSDDLSNISAWTNVWETTNSVNNYGFTQWGWNDRYLAIGVALNNSYYIRYTSDGINWINYNTTFPCTNQENHPLIWMPGNGTYGVFINSQRYQGIYAYANIYIFDFENQTLTYQDTMPTLSSKSYGYDDFQHSNEMDDYGNIYIGQLVMQDGGSQMLKYNTSVLMNQRTGVITPDASFSSNWTGSLPRTKAIAFTDTSTNTPTSWAWSMGDGTANITTQNVSSYRYTKNGLWTVVMTATNTAGSSSNSTQVRVVG